jgi:hypothetical protein
VSVAQSANRVVVSLIAAPPARASRPR